MFDVPHVLWLDNYAHILRVNLPTARSGLWRNSSSWSAKAAIIQESLRNSDVALKTNDQNGMPDLNTLFSNLTIDRFKKYFGLREKQSSTSFEACFSKNERRIPIKPNSEKTLLADLDRKFIPLAILEHNIGSNDGLSKILMEVRTEEHNKPHTPALLVDCNIYWRVMKVSFVLFVGFTILNTYCIDSCRYISLPYCLTLFRST